MLRGFVYSENNEPLIGASIRIVNLGTGTITNEQGKYEIKVLEGLNRLSVSTTGYKTEVIEVVSEKDVVQNIFLKIDQKQLDEVVVRNKKRDYSYEVIKNVIDNKANFLNQFQNFQCETYIKSTEEIDKKAKTPKVDNDLPKTDNPLDKKDSIPNLNLFECQLIRHENNAGQQKEEKQAVKKIGDQKTLFFKSITDGEFNLYKNHQKIAKIGDNEITSPFSDVAFLSYKFQLLSYAYEDKHKIYRIKVIPREAGNALYEGEIEVVDELWVLRKANLKLTKRALLLYDEFGFEQEYTEMDKRWLPTKTTYQWKIKANGTKKTGKTLVLQSKFEFDKTLPKRFFGAEVGVTTEQAYKRDSTFWEAIRPQPLSKEELSVVKEKDRLDILHNSKAYLDSIDKVYNHITWQKVLYEGIGHINRNKKNTINYASMINLVDPVAIGGWRMRYFVNYYKRYENRKQISVMPYFTYGFLNKDLRGMLDVNYFYNPKRVSNIRFSVNSGFGVINGTATLNDLIKRGNFYQNKSVNVKHRTELLNGLYLNSGIFYEKRSDFAGFKFAKFGDNLSTNNVPAAFPTSQIFKTEFEFEYTPKQLYLREPNEKIILGSRYPTFRIKFENAYPVAGKNMSTYSYISGSIRQSFNIGVFGTSEYRIEMGKFLDTTRLAIMDYKYQRGGDKRFFSPAMYTFQLIPKTFPTFNWYLEAHYVHQFNGYLTSKIPLLNKTKIREMAGAGFLYVPERKYQYSEVFFGLNRVFKFGKAMLRLGSYYVIAQSNDFGIRNMLKFSIEPYNQTKNTWSF